MKILHRLAILTTHPFAPAPGTGDDRLLSVPVSWPEDALAACTLPAASASTAYFRGSGTCDQSVSEAR